MPQCAHVIRTAGGRNYRCPNNAHTGRKRCGKCTSRCSCGQAATLYRDRTAPVKPGNVPEGEGHRENKPHPFSVTLGDQGTEGANRKVVDTDEAARFFKHVAGTGGCEVAWYYVFKDTFVVGPPSSGEIPAAISSCEILPCLLHWHDETGGTARGAVFSGTETSDAQIAVKPRTTGHTKLAGPTSSTRAHGSNVNKPKLPGDLWDGRKRSGEPEIKRAGGTKWNPRLKGLVTTVSWGQEPRTSLCHEIGSEGQGTAISRLRLSLTLSHCGYDDYCTYYKAAESLRVQDRVVSWCGDTSEVLAGGERYPSPTPPSEPNGGTFGGCTCPAPPRKDINPAVRQRDIIMPESMQVAVYTAASTGLGAGDVPLFGSTGMYGCLPLDLWTTNDAAFGGYYLRSEVPQSGSAGLSMSSTGLEITILGATKMVRKVSDLLNAPWAAVHGRNRLAIPNRCRLAIGTFLEWCEAGVVCLSGNGGLTEPFKVWFDQPLPYCPGFPIPEGTEVVSLPSSDWWHGSDFFHGMETGPSLLHREVLIPLGMELREVMRPVATGSCTRQLSRDMVDPGDMDPWACRKLEIPGVGCVYVREVDLVRADLAQVLIQPVVAGRIADLDAGGHLVVGENNAMLLLREAWEPRGAGDYVVHSVEVGYERYFIPTRLDTMEVASLCNEATSGAELHNTLVSGVEGWLSGKEIVCALSDPYFKFDILEGTGCHLKLRGRTSSERGFDMRPFRLQEMVPYMMEKGEEGGWITTIGGCPVDTSGYRESIREHGVTGDGSSADRRGCFGPVRSDIVKGDSHGGPVQLTTMY